MALCLPSGLHILGLLYVIIGGNMLYRLMFLHAKHAYGQLLWKLRYHVSPLLLVISA